MGLDGEWGWMLSLQLCMLLTLLGKRVRTNLRLKDHERASGQSFVSADTGLIPRPGKAWTIRIGIHSFPA